MLNNINIALVFLSGIAFILYGLSILLTDHMYSEFIRYKMIKFRVLTGWLELMGGIGILSGAFAPQMGSIFAFCLGTLMLMGSIVRIRIKDPLIETLPALILMVLNYYLFYALVSHE